MNKSLTAYYFDVAKLNDCKKSFAATAAALACRQLRCCSYRLAP
jgi:hypothetical protein